MIANTAFPVSRNTYRVSSENAYYSTFAAHLPLICSTVLSFSFSLSRRVWRKFVGKLRLKIGEKRWGNWRGLRAKEKIVVQNNNRAHTSSTILWIEIVKEAKIRCTARFDAFDYCWEPRGAFEICIRGTVGAYGRSLHVARIELKVPTGARANVIENFTPVRHKWILIQQLHLSLVVRVVSFNTKWKWKGVATN